MQSLSHRILSALALGPMTVPMLAKALWRTTARTRDVVRELRRRGKIVEVNRIWNARVYELVKTQSTGRKQ